MSMVDRVDLESFRTLSDQYEERKAAYDQALDEYRSRPEADRDPAVKARLDAEFKALDEVYGRLSVMRQGLTDARDAALASLS